MKSYYRVMLGRSGAQAPECVAGGFIGVNDLWGDLTSKLPDDWRDFNKAYIPVFLSKHPDKSKIAAGLACGVAWTVAKGIKIGDVILSPDGSGSYYVGTVTGDYSFAPGLLFPHRRTVRWMERRIPRTDMSGALRNSSGSIGTVSTVTRYAEEIERLIAGIPVSTLISTDPEIEDPSIFALEKHLEDFLVQNWSQTELGRDYNIYEEDGERRGQQFATDTGNMDILAISKDKKTLLVVELKKGRASDSVVGQVLRYMGFVKQELADADQAVRGVIIALEDDKRLRRALAVAPAIDFYRYQVSFKLTRG